MILPELSPEMARQLALRVGEFLRSVGETAKFSSQVLQYDYPKDVASVQEMEEIVDSLLPGARTLPVDAS